MPKESLLKDRIKGFKNAFRGIFILVRSEQSIQVQLAVALFMCGCGWFFAISCLEWMVQLLCMALILGLEGANTSIEKLADFVHPNHHKKIGILKDVAAGAVLIAGIFVVIIGLLIYVPRIM